MAISIMFVSMAMYMQIPIFQDWLTSKLELSSLQKGLIIASPGIGIFSLGWSCSYLIERYQRDVMCIRAILAMGVFLLGLLLVYQQTTILKDVFIVLLLIRFFMGAFYGLAQMILLSALTIDICESFQRTEANHSSVWFSRFALSLGPAIALCVLPLFGVNLAIIIAIVLCVIATILIFMVKFPFKAPEDVIHKVSLDRFFLPRAKYLFINLTIITISIGIVLSIESSLMFYTFLMVGFFIALLSTRFVFVNADLKAEIITGLILLFAGLLLMITSPQETVKYLSPILIGTSIGIIGSRFLLFFVKLSHHLQRGTSVSTFFLSWELGIYIGVFLAESFFQENMIFAFTFSSALIILALIIYIFFTHKWYIQNKNR